MGGLKVGHVLLTIFLVASLDDVSGGGESCVWYGGWLNVEVPCPPGNTEAFLLSTTRGRYSKMCCSNPREAKEQGESKGKECQTSECITDGGDPCGTVVRAGHKSIKINKESIRDECTDDRGRKGVAAVCCPSDATGSVLMSVYGAEMNEFPHHANVGGCGGTVYNKDFILTAAHCLVDQAGYVKDKLPTIVLGTNIGGLKSKDNTYEVEKVIVHEEYSKLANQSAAVRRRTFNDVALVKLNRSINFEDNPKIKALKVAPANFNPADFANQVIIVGWGVTIDLTSSEHLQKTNLPIRTYEQCYGESTMKIINGQLQWTKWGPYFHQADKANQYLCIGGVIDGSYAEIAGHGDSGGPAICRDKDGYAVHCGITSFSSTDDDVCAKGQNEESCTPSIYTSVSHFRDWIQLYAGPQDKRTFYTVPLYGQNAPQGKYKHQVHIEGKDGTVCGGTLVSQDKVVTAGHCILDDNKGLRKGLKVYAGIHDLKNKGQSNMYKVVGVRGVETFARYHEMDQLASQKYKTMRNGYYIDDLAIVKLDRKVPISDGEIPKLATSHPPRQSSALEVAFPLDTSRSGSLMERKFKILDEKDCHVRLERLEQLNVTAKFDTDRVFCGVERYSGGSICDREDGGGVICKNEQGEEELCGIQTFRLCRTAIPSAFLSIGRYEGYIKESMAVLDQP